MSEAGEALDSDGDSNLMFEELDGVRVDAAFNAQVAPDLVCIDSGCNKIVLQLPPDRDVSTYVVAVGRALRTASAGSSLAIAGTGVIDNSNGSITEFRHCPDATANLMPTLAISKTGAHIHIFLHKPTREEVCLIMCKYLDLQKTIQCNRINDLFWISLTQMYDFVFRDGFAADEYADAFHRNNNPRRDSLLFSLSSEVDVEANQKVRI